MYLLICCFFSISGFAQSPIVLSFDDPSMVPTDCNIVFSEEGVSQQFLDVNGTCSFFYETSNGGEIGLAPAVLSVDLTGLGIIDKIEVDQTDFCGTGCSEVTLLNNGGIILSVENTVVGNLETLILNNTAAAAVDELTLISFEGFFFEIRIFNTVSDPCNGTGDSDGDNVCDALDQCPGFDDMIDRDGNGVPDYCDFCDDNRTMMEPSQSGDMLTYEAIGQITSGQTIQSGANIIFNAGTSVNLIEGFEVELGAVLTTFIFGCGF